ncbi:MAG: hypothetical protein ACOWW1_10860 [archaeon]
MKKMKNISKTHLSTIALVLIFTLSTLAILPSAFAQSPGYKETFPFIGAIPDPVGVNQQVLLHIGIPTPIAWPQPGWYGLTVEVTDPSGHTEILGPFDTDTTGGTGAVFTPTQVGTYTLVTHFPEQPTEVDYARIGPAGTVMLESYSEPLELIVQSEAKQYYQGQPQPTEYWSRPINGQLWSWTSFGGQWLHTTNRAQNFNDRIKDNNDMPMAPHILWAKVQEFGGLVGGDGELGFHSYDCGDAYEGKWSPPVIINGVLYYNQFNSNGGTNVEQEVVAVDLHTGEEVWRRPLVDSTGAVQRLAFGQIFYWDSYNMHGAFPYLWATSGSTWHAFDAATGRWVYSMTDVPSGANLYGSKGEIYRYVINLNAGTMSLWNSSRVVSTEGSWLRGNQGTVFNATNGIEWTKDIPSGLTGAVHHVRYGEIVVGALDQRSAVAHNPTRFWAFSLEPGHEGDLIFDVEWDLPRENVTIHLTQISVEEDIFVVYLRETCEFYGFSLSTGEELWGPTLRQSYLDAYGFASQNDWEFIYDGKLISGNVGGIVYCYDVQTGDRLWTFENTDPYSEILWSNNWPIRKAFISNGILVISHDEHSPIDPMPRGAPTVVVDLETGEQVWSVNIRGTQWGGTPVIGDSIIAAYNTYDNRIYAIGKGPSAITVEAPLTGATTGSNVVIRGSVTDISPGTADYSIAARFPNGVPVMSDADMNEWMQYVYMQFEQPCDVTGVEVLVEAIDPNGNYQTLGTTTTDINGVYSLMWTPEVDGKYDIYVTFAGTESYYGSTTSTAMPVDPAAAPASPMEPEQPTDNESPAEPTQAPFITTEIAIVLAVAVLAAVGVAAYWILKRK